MLEKPDIEDSNIIACLQDVYGLPVVNVSFLALGNDVNTAAYRVVAEDKTSYFLKLRQGVFDETSVAVPKFLNDQGIAQVMAPIANRSEQLWTALAEFNVILYPFVEGHNGFQVGLSDRHWVDFGRAFKAIHNAILPPALVNRVQCETYSPQWREMVKMFQARVEQENFRDPTAAKLAAFLKAKSDEVHYLVARAEQLASALQTKPQKFVVCHADIHVGNILIGADDAFYIVDWDNPILAPK